MQETGDTGLIPGSGRSPGEGNNSNPHHYSHLGNAMDKGAWRAKVHGVTKTERLSMHAWINIWHVFLTTVILPKDML